jgi:hypothetical protein
MINTDLQLAGSNAICIEHIWCRRWATDYCSAGLVGIGLDTDREMYA